MKKSSVSFLSMTGMIAIIFFSGTLPASSQTDDVGNYEVQWIGNSLPRGAINDDERSHVQHWIWGIEVSPDGRVYAGGGNESGHAISVFQDGDLESDYIPKANVSGQKEVVWNWNTLNNGAVSFDDDYIYSVNAAGYVNKWEREPPYHRVQVMMEIGLHANEIVVKFNKMYLVDINTGEIQIRELDEDYTLINSFTVDGAYDIAVDSENSIWVSMGGGSHGPDGTEDALNEIRRYDADGNQLSGTLTGFGNLMGISIGNHQGRLIVADDGSDKQVLFYDISDPSSPVLDRTFGEQGGIYSGDRGVLNNDLQLFDVQDAGTDADGNIYVHSSQSSFIDGETGGTMIRAYSPEEEKLWELSSELWTGCASVLPSIDGEEIYGVEEVFKLDPNADNSSCDPNYRHGFCDPDWKLEAITYDDIGDPDDFRVSNNFANRAFRGSAEIREIDGKRVIFRQNMNAGTIPPKDGGYDLLVFEDRPSMISHHKGQLHGNKGAWYPDLGGNVWEGNAGDDKIRKHKFGGFDGDGSPSYLTYDEYDAPDWFSSMITRIYYDTDNDVMYLSGYSEESRYDDRWYDGEETLPTGIAGTHLLRYDNWSEGNRDPSYEIELLWDGSNRSLPPKTWYKAGDYIFTAPVRRDDDGKIIISVFDAQTGDQVGTMDHYDEFGMTGWVDIVRGITAFQRSNGEYIVIFEDNAYAKNVVYRWCPSGNCSETLEVNLTNPSEDGGMVDLGTFDIQAEVSGDDGYTIEEVEFYVDNELVGSDADGPYSHEWDTPGSGLYELHAKVITESGAYKISPSFEVEFTDGSPAGEVVRPLEGEEFTVLDIVSLEAETRDYDGTVEKVEFYENGNLICEATEEPYQCDWEYPEAGDYDITANIVDDEGNETVTSAVSVSVTDKLDISFSEPQNDEFFEPGSDVLLQVDLSSFETVDSVKYFNVEDDSALGTSETEPFSYTMSEAETGIYQVSATIYYGEGREVTLSNGVKFFVASQDDNIEMAINCGELEEYYIAQDDIVYSPDNEYCIEGCNDNRTQQSYDKSISGTDDDFIYQSNRYSNVGTTDFSYAKEVENGDYEVTLKFAEIYNNDSGVRVFDVNVEDNEVISELDIYDRVGKNAALDITDTVTVNDGELKITIMDDVGNALISGILVKKLSENVVPPAAPENLNASLDNGGVELSWDANDEFDLNGYNVYRSTTSGSDYTQVNGSLVGDAEFVDNTVDTDFPYYYVVTAVDDADNESEHSDEIEVNPVSVSEVSDGSGIHFYPNPLEGGKLTIELGEAYKEAMVVVHDLRGVVVYQKMDSGTEMSIPSEEFPGEGVYIISISISNGNKTVNEKLIVK